jgi:chromosome partitioning protein
MAHVIVFANIKGGPGKTTMALHVAAALAKKKMQVLVIDADPQGSAVKWSGAADEEFPFPVPVMGYAQKQIHKTIQQMSDQYDYLVVDTPPSGLAAAAVTRQALLVADLVVVPVVPSPVDIWEAAEIARMIEELNELREGAGAESLPARLLINRLKPGTTTSKEVRAALDQVGLPILKTAVHEREAFKHAATYGAVVADLKGVYRAWQAAAADVDKLTNELLTIMR